MGTHTGPTPHWVEIVCVQVLHIGLQSFFELMTAPLQTFLSHYLRTTAP